MNVNKLAATLLPVSLLGSCVYMPDMVPDMPYSGSMKTETTTPAQQPRSSGVFGQQQQSPLQQVQQQQPQTPTVTPPPSPSIPTATALPPAGSTAPTATAVPGAGVQTVPQATPTAPPATRQPVKTPAPTTITTSPSKVQPVITPQRSSTSGTAAPKVTTPRPVSSAEPAAAAKSAPAATTPPATKPAVKAVETPPVASRVPGDPFRVYNPYEPSKTILIKGANGQPFPSGKKLKIQGTDKYFIVP